MMHGMRPVVKAPSRRTESPRAGDAHDLGPTARRSEPGASADGPEHPTVPHRPLAIGVSGQQTREAGVSGSAWTIDSVVGLDDPIYAWHVRSLDVWIYGATNPLMDSWDQDDEKREIESHWPWRTGEKDAFSRLLAKYFKPDKVKDFMTNLEERKLEFFKVVLYFTLPRLRELRYSSPIQDDCTIDDLYWAQSYLKQGHPPVLQQLESVAVGVDLGATREHPRPLAELGPDTLIQLMCLPNLKSLYCYGLGCYNTTLLLGGRELETQPWQEAIKEPRSSSLEHLYLDCVKSWPKDLPAFQDYVASIPAALKTFVIRPQLTQPNDLGRPNINVESFALAVLKHQEDSIQSCVVYDHQARDPGLACLAKTQTAGEWGMRHHLNNFDAAASPEAALQLSLTTHINFFTTDVALSRLCVLTLHGDNPNEFLGWPECVDVLEEGIMALIRSKRNPRLRTIHLVGFQDRIGRVDTRSGTIRFQKAIIEGIKHSVDVYTSTTPMPLATLMDRRMALVPKAFRNECPAHGIQCANWHVGGSALQPVRRVRDLL
ncbi:hypothetical protein B0T11DRAFT_349321 [Plectosphaerella cucumerina]|uniref:Uncharacterized protein n=1 Tax=Plectosphaerella cucumerina TaxID=40658 RepID=A0A8K0TK82_9PEZI|nr:hypothetical protein B0T11DRAFT_349321 [Plectosphaerella cucumerina]